MMTDDKTAPSSTAPDTPFASFTGLQSAGFGTLMKHHVDWLESLGDMGAELAEFMAGRIKQDIDTQHRILHSGDLAEVQKIQNEFIQDAVAQYQAETGKLVEMSMSALAVKDSKAT